MHKKCAFHVFIIHKTHKIVNMLLQKYSDLPFTSDKATQQLITNPVDGCYMTGIGDTANKSVRCR